MAHIVSQTSNEFTIQVTIKLSGSMLDMETAIQKCVNEVGCVATTEALMQFESTGQMIDIAGVRLYSKDKVKKDYETPYGM